MKKYIWIAALLFTYFSSNGQSMIVELNGTISFDNSQLSITEAGLNFPSSIVNEPTVTLSVLFSDQSGGKTNLNQKWRIFINKSDLVWNSNLSVEAIRTGPGQSVDSKGTSTISDGEIYQQITNIPAYFFKGRGQIAYIPLQFRVNGLSVVLGANNFETNIVLTVYDDW